METSPLAETDPQAWAERFAASLRAKRDRAREVLAAQRTRLEQAEMAVERERHRVAQSPAGDACRAADDDLQRRYEMSLDDIRQLRDTNAELQQQLAKARSATVRQAQEPGWLDWEAEKQRIVAALEADCAGDDQQRQAEHPKIADVVRKTDEVVAAKDREIEELKQRLEESAGSGEQSGDASTQHILDSDAVIRAERERLGRLQAEWQDKLRQAEVDFALERAKTARQRAELEEQLRVAKGAASQSPAAHESNTPMARSLGGRWLTRLGLTADDRETGRHQ